MLLHGGLLFSTIMTHCGMDKIVMNLRVHAVILQIFHGPAKSFLNQLLRIWSEDQARWDEDTPPLTWLNSTCSEYVMNLIVDTHMYPNLMTIFQAMMSIHRVQLSLTGPGFDYVKSRCMCMCVQLYKHIMCMTTMLVSVTHTDTQPDNIYLYWLHK